MMAANPSRRSIRSGDPEDTGTWLWQVPQKPVSVRIALPLVARLERQVSEAVRSVRTRGSEIGGLLLGSVSGTSPALVSVQDYDLVPCDYSRGPLYKLAGEDRDRVERRIAVRSAAGRLGVVGFFRSHTRAGFSLDDDDVALCRSYFNGPHQVFLLVRPAPGRVARAGFFIWEHGQIRAEATHLEFPFSFEDLGGKDAVPEVAPFRGTVTGARPTAAQTVISLGPVLAKSQPPALPARPVPQPQPPAPAASPAPTPQVPASAPQSRPEAPAAPVATPAATSQVPAAAPQSAAPAAASESRRTPSPPATPTTAAPALQTASGTLKITAPAALPEPQPLSLRARVGRCCVVKQLRPAAGAKTAPAPQARAASSAAPRSTRL